MLFLNTDGTVKNHQKISDTEGGFAGTLVNDDRLGSSVVDIGDLDGDNITDLAVGTREVAANSRGAVWILSLNGSAGSVINKTGSFSIKANENDVRGSINGSSISASVIIKSSSYCDV